MEKIISLYQRNYDGDRLVRDEIVPGAEWVTAGEGVATRKWDGTACLVRAGRLYQRYDAKRGRTPPGTWEPAQAEPDAITGHWPGWVPVVEGDPASKWHRAVWEGLGGAILQDGTYEMCGPHVQGNPEGLPVDCFIKHGAVKLPDAPRDFAGVHDYLTAHVIEGIVWHHPDGRMVKIKARDFGLKWPR